MAAPFLSYLKLGFITTGQTLDVHYLWVLTQVRNLHLGKTF
jgi:hypothetical protein